MASKKKTATQTKTPDTSARTSEEYANDLRNKSSSSRFATYERVPGKNGDGDLILEHRGEPEKT